MIFIDSWIWLEFFLEDESWKASEKVIEKLEDEQGVIASTVLLEVRYRINRKFGGEKADRVTTLINSFDNLEILPVTAEAAIYAADLRRKYYKRDERELSYADAIHIAIASMTECDELYTGDPDFENVDEIQTHIIG
ncbi:MAG: PIN domain-containing protein [Halobacteria archaeon]|nr:PIN domain-containing protein [Halobacteria archaeon]